ncbi:unnamed protein product [Lampetra fluviatilis]
MPSSREDSATARQNRTEPRNNARARHVSPQPLPAPPAIHGESLGPTCSGARAKGREDAARIDEKSQAPPGVVGSARRPRQKPSRVTGPARLSSWRAEPRPRGGVPEARMITATDIGD